MSVTYVVEGDVDRTVLRTLLGSQAQILPTKDKATPMGREAAITRAAAAAQRIAPQRVVLVLDRNSHSEAELVAEVQAGLRRAWNREDLTANTGWWRFTDEQAVRLVLAGLPEHPTLREFGVTRHMMDDYLLLLMLRERALNPFCSGEHNLAWTPPTAAELRQVIDDLAAVLRHRKIAVDSAKRWLDLVRAAVGFQASRAILAQGIIQRCPPTEVDDVFVGLRQDLAGPQPA